VRYAIDQAGVELIASFEGYVDGVYADSEGFATCGYGHLLHESPPTDADRREYDGRGRAFFLNLLHEDIERDAIGPMNAALRVPLDENELNAVADACYNCGPGFVEGTVGELINRRQFAAAANAFMLWDNPPVLIPRRETERRLFLTPVHPSLPFPWLEPWERAAVLEYDELLAHDKDRNRRLVLRVVMTGYRKGIWLAAEGKTKAPAGWEILNRRQRYQSLLARTD
jgi:GH24 family phage-related lysozyme (muramidase)